MPPQKCKAAHGKGLERVVVQKREEGVGHLPQGVYVAGERKSCLDRIGKALACRAVQAREEREQGHECRKEGTSAQAAERPEERACGAGGKRTDSECSHDKGPARTKVHTTDPAHKCRQEKQ